MSILSAIITKTIQTISSYDIYGITQIHAMAFYNSKLKSIGIPETCKAIGRMAFGNCKNLSSVTIPSSIEYIGVYAFMNTEALQSCNLNNIKPTCQIRPAAFSGAYFFENATSNLYGGNGKILIKAVSSSWPSGITNLAAHSCNALVKNAKLIIPDTIQILGGSPTNLDSDNALTDLTIGSNISELISDSIPNTVTTLVCRQPAGMKITLPAETGDGKGLSYKKEARNMTLYTDNEDMKNYDWAGDNVTVTIYPLSQAPV